jgi:hypothetical protein
MKTAPTRQIVSAMGIFAAAIVGPSVWIGPVAAEEFRVESKVYSGKNDTPVSESLTLFADGRVYDFLSSPREITVFDFPRGRIVLIDPARKLRTELTTEQLNDFIDKLRARASRQTDSLLKFAAQPKFNETNEADDWQQFASPQLTYRVRAVKSENSAMVRAYREFSDGSARLNAMLHPGALPPFPRLEVNASLERNMRMPEELELTITPSNHLLGKPTVMHSTHELANQLLPTDRKKIDEAGEYLVNLNQVPLDEYLRPENKHGNKEAAGDQNNRTTAVAAH